MSSATPKARYPLDSAVTPPISAGKSTTALLMLDYQLGYRNVAAFGTGASNPAFEANSAALLGAFRAAWDAGASAASDGDGGENKKPWIVHVQHRAVWTDSPLNSGHSGPYGEKDGETKRGIDFLEFAAPRMGTKDGLRMLYTFDEPSAPQEKADDGRKPRTWPRCEELMTSHTQSVWGHHPLEGFLVDNKIKTLVVAGLTTDGAVSTAVRLAYDLAVRGHWGGCGNMWDTARASLWTDGEGRLRRGPGSEPEGGWRRRTGCRHATHYPRGRCHQMLW